MGESVSESVVEYVELALISIPIDEEVLQEEDDGCNSEDESSTSHCEEEEECNCILCRGTQLIRNKTRHVFKRHSTHTSLGHPSLKKKPSHSSLSHSPPKKQSTRSSLGSSSPKRQPTYTSLEHPPLKKQSTHTSFSFPSSPKRQATRTSLQLHPSASVKSVRRDPCLGVPVVVVNDTRSKTRKYSERVVLCLVIAMVWALYAVPTILYYVPEDSSEDDNSLRGPYCSREVYKGDICMESLLAYQNCLQANTSTSSSTDMNVYIPGGRDQNEMEAEILLTVHILQPSPDCEVSLVPFLCLQLFGLCDSNRKVFLPTSEECGVLRDEVCPQEWQRASLAGDQFALPPCEELLDMSTSCKVTLKSADGSSGSAQTGDDVIECSSGFYLDANYTGLCLPLCREWKQFSDKTAMIVNSIVIASALVYVFVTVLILVLSLIQHRRMFKFPSVFIIYQTVSLGVFQLFQLIGYSNTEALYCSSKDFVSTIEDPTPFCVTIGVLLHYSVVTTALLWFSHILAVSWGIWFPFHARSYGQQKTPHLIFLLVCIIASGAILSGTFATGGFATRMPPITCTTAHEDGTYYFIVLPVSIVSAAGVTLLVLIMWVLIKLNRSHCQENIGIKAPIRSYIKAKVKIIICFLYYSIFIAISLICITAITRVFPMLLTEINDYFKCESTGMRPGKECKRSNFENIDPTAIALTMANVIGAGFPIVNLLYVVNVRELRESWGRMKAKLHSWFGGQSSHRPCKNVEKESGSNQENGQSPTGSGDATSSALQSENGQSPTGSGDATSSALQSGE